MSVSLRAIVAESLRHEFLQSLRVIEAAQPPAFRQGKAECCRSGLCCWRRPGELAVADVPLIAAYLGLTPEQLFRQYLLVDAVDGNFYLLPRRAHQEGGQMIGWQETYSAASPCVFLDTDHGNACRVHDVKPLACREYQCWEADRPWSAEGFPREELERLGWDGVNPDDGED